MQLFGISLRKPTFNQTTASVVMATGLWLAGLGMARAAGITMDRADAGAFLIVAVWGCLSSRFGIHIGHGGRHLVASMLGSLLLLGLYESAFRLAA